MKQSLLLSVFVVAVFSVPSFALEKDPVHEGIVKSLTSKPISFTRNDGQIDTHGKADLRFYATVGGANYFFCADGMVADFQKSGLEANLDHSIHESRVPSPESRVVGHVLKLNFLARTNFLAEVHGQDEQEYKCNYFVGSDAAKWHANVPNYSRIVYKDVWRGVDIAYHNASAQRGLEYDVIVHPGANPNQIQFAYEGQDALSINSNGNLVLKTSVGDVMEQTPYVYQIIDGVKKEISSRFVLADPGSPGDQPLFTFALDDYDKTKDLVIDPIYSTFLGGTYDDFGNAIAVDAGGNAYITGSTKGSNFPTTAGAYNTTNQYSDYAFVTKLNAAGSALVYSTFIGYSSGGKGIAVDAAGNVFITGSTDGFFPVYPNPGAFQTTHGGKGINFNNDAFVTKLNATGSALIYSTYLGGLNEDKGYAIAIDSSGCAYVTGSTAGKGNNFPITQGAYQPAAKGDLNAFVAKLNATGSDLVYSTFLGGAVSTAEFQMGKTECRAIAIDHNNNAYVTGSTFCSDFPTTQGAYQPLPKLQPNVCSIFMTKLKPSGQGANDLLYSTYLGGYQNNYYEFGYGIAVDTDGNAYITGNTGGNFPTTPGAFKTTGYGGFMTKLKPAGQGNNDLLYSTYLGPSVGYGITVDVSGNAFITGSAGEGFPTTAGAFQTTGPGSFVASLKPVGQGNNDLLYSTYLRVSGRRTPVGGAGIAVDAEGNAYVTGDASVGFPTTVGAFQTTFGGGNDAFVTKFGLSPNIATLDSFDMGRVMCDPAQKAFVVYNPSEMLLKIDSIKIVDTTNFTVVSPEIFPVSVSPNSSVQIIVNFKPGTPGSKTSTLKIYSNDHTPLSDSEKKITLLGIVDPKNRFITMNKTKLDFGSIGCDSSMSDLKITVYDTSITSVTIKPIIVGSESSFFTITPLDSTIDFGDSVVYTVHFQPISGGHYDAKLWFLLSQCSQLDTIELTGIKNSSVSFTALPHTLEYFSCGPNEVDSVITIKNTGSASLTLDSGVVNGLGFSLVSPQGKVTVAPGDSIKYVIRFTSQQLDKYTGTFTVSGPCQAISQHDLVGWKTSLLVAPKSIDFGGLSCNDQYRDTSITVTSKGSQAIVTATIVGGSFSALTPSMTIKADSSKDFQIRFKPDSAGIFHAKLIFTTSACPGIQDTVDLIGGKASTVCLSTDPKVLQFDTLSCEVTGGNQEDDFITLCNCSSSQITLDTAHVTGNGFTLTDPFGKKILSAGECQDYTIRFSPSGPGTYSGTFNVNGMPCYIGSSVSLAGVCKPTVGVSAEKQIPLEFSLDQNHPNPFSRFTIVGCRLSIDASFEVRDMLGRVMYQTHVNKNSTEVTIDASMLSNGLYLYSLGDGTNIQSRMMMVVH